MLFNEFDEFLEIMFVMKGSIVIGFDVNKLRHYCIKLTNGCEIGAFGCSFHQRSCYIYTAATNIEGYFIRKQNWMEMLNEFP